MTPRSPTPEFLPYARHAVTDEDVAAVAAVLRGDWLTTGPAVAALETELRQRTGAAHAVSCSSGTAALHLACLALGLGPGDAVIVPSITFLATANAARMCGAEIVFADVGPDDALMSQACLEEAFVRAETQGLKVKAVFTVHYAGQCAEPAGLAEAARTRGAAVVEDASHAIGSYHACPDGSAAPVGGCRFSDMTVFSFHPTKTIAAGEGGAVTTNDAWFAERLARLRCHGMTREARDFTQQAAAFDRGVPNPWYYEQSELGWNYRLSDIHAALATSQLQRLDRLVEERRALAVTYDEFLAGRCLPARPIRRRRGCLPAWHLYPVLLDFERLGISRRRVMSQLAASGIGTQVHYIPVHRQPYYLRRSETPNLPGADSYYRRTLSLPLYIGLTDRDQKRVVRALEEVLEPPISKRAAS